MENVVHGLTIGAVLGALAVVSVHRANASQERMLQIGDPSNVACSVTVHESVWPDLNRIGIYRWVAACEQN